MVDNELSLAEVVASIETAEQGSRTLDALIARLLGWEERRDQHNSHPNGKSKFFWTDPSGEQARVPRYTTSLHAAYELATSLCGGETAAVTWKAQEGSHAQIGLDREAHYAATPALALCAAVLVSCIHKVSVTRA